MMRLLQLAGKAHLGVDHNYSQEMGGHMTDIEWESDIYVLLVVS